MTKDEALGILQQANWMYMRRISKERPYPAAITDNPGISAAILHTAGIDVSGRNGEGIALLPEDGNTRYAVFGHKNIRYLNDANISFGQEHRIFRADLDPDGFGGVCI